MLSRRKRKFNHRAALHQMKSRYQVIDPGRSPRPDSIFVSYLRQAVDSKFFDFDPVRQTRKPKNIERLEMCMERFWWSVAVDMWERLFVLERCPFRHMQPSRESSNPCLDQVHWNPDLTGLQQRLVMAQYRYDLDTALDEIDDMLAVRAPCSAAHGTDHCRPSQPYKSKIRQALWGTIGVPAPDGVTERAHKLWYWVDDFGGPAPTYKGYGRWEIPLPSGLNAKVYFDGNRVSALNSRLGVQVVPVWSTSPHHLRIDPVQDVNRSLDVALFVQWRAFGIIQDWIDDVGSKGYCVDVVDFCAAQFHDATIRNRRRVLQRVLADIPEGQSPQQHSVEEALLPVHEFKIKGLASHVEKGPSNLPASHACPDRKRRRSNHDIEMEINGIYGGSHWKRLRCS